MQRLKQAPHRTLSFILVALFLPIFLQIVRAQTQSVPNTEWIDRWLNTQTNIHTWTAEFIQTRTFKSLTHPLVATGQVWFAEPNQFRWELGNPPQTIAVRQPEQLLVMYPRLKRVEQYSLRADETGPWKDALALFEAGFPRSRAELEERFTITGQSLTNNIVNVVLQPKSSSAKRLMPQITLAFRTNDLSLHATELLFTDGSTLRNEFKSPILNPDLPKNVFDPAIPPGFNVARPFQEKSRNRK